MLVPVLLLLASAAGLFHRIRSSGKIISPNRGGEPVNTEGTSSQSNVVEEYDISEIRNLAGSANYEEMETPNTEQATPYVDMTSGVSNMAHHSFQVDDHPPNGRSSLAYEMPDSEALYTSLAERDLEKSQYQSLEAESRLPEVQSNLAYEIPASTTLYTSLAGRDLPQNQYQSPQTNG